MQMAPFHGLGSHTQQEAGDGESPPPAFIATLPDYGHHVASCLMLLSPCSPHLEGLYHGPKSILCFLSSFCYSKEKGLVPAFNEVTKGLIGIC